MTTSTYFEYLEAYINSEYVIDDGTGGWVVLREECVRLDEEGLQIELVLPDVGVVFKFDHDDFDIKKESKSALFHFSMTMRSHGLNSAISSFFISKIESSAVTVLNSNPRA